MKSVFTVIFLHLIAALYSQQIEVEYSATLRMILSEEDKQEMLKDSEYGREQIKMNEEPEPAYYTMLISDKESSFTYIQKISNEQDPNKPVIRQAPAGFGTIYHNLLDSISRRDFDVYGTKYHSVDSLEVWNWKITKESKIIMDYEVRKATSEDDEKTITAWYAPKINVSNGPADFWGLPGLILDVKIQYKFDPLSITYLAESISYLKKKPKLTVPTKGQKIKRSEIDAIYEEVNRRRNELNQQSSIISGE